MGTPTMPPVRMSTRSNLNNTPKKVNPKRKRLSPLNVVNLPGKKKLKTSATTTRKTTGKCQVCGVIYESKDDKMFRKKNGTRKTTWVGCDKSDCTFWAHAACAGLLLVPNKPVDKHKFLCKDHRH